MILPSLDNPPIVIRESRWKAGLLAVGSAVMVWLSPRMLTEPGNSPIAGYIGLTIFGASAVWYLAQLFRPTTLTLDQSGFRVDQLLHTYETRWDQVSNLRIEQGYRSIVRYIAYDVAGGSSVVAVLSGRRRLPAYWTIGPPDLLTLMQHCKDRWGVRGQPAGASAVGPRPLQRREPTVS